MRRTFERIYELNTWFKSPLDEEAPLLFLRFLRRFVQARRVRSLLDIGMGFWGYMRRMDFKALSYTGIDVAEGVVRYNADSFGSDNVRFLRGDALEMDLPKADLVVLKHVLQHWSNADILRILPKLKAYPLVLVGNSHLAGRDKDWDGNEDIPTGPGMRPKGLRLDAPPFNLRCEEVLRCGNGRPYEDTVVLIENPQGRGE